MDPLKITLLKKKYRILLVILIGLAFTYFLTVSRKDVAAFRQTIPVSPNTKIIQLMPGWENYNGPIAPTSASCHEYSCSVISSYSSVQEASDLVVFHVRKLTRSPPTRPTADQLWLLYTAESQQTMRLDDLEAYDHLFNYSYTFVVGSDFPDMYGNSYRKRENPKSQNFAELKRQFCNNGKCESVLWFVSNCNSFHALTPYPVTSGRVNYAHDLNNYITVSAFSKWRWLCTAFHPLTMPDLIKSKVSGGEPELSEYYFYLAFENSYCRDYITEKFWKILQSDSLTIPVVMGGLSMVDYETVAPPNSYIDVRNFSSPQSLAEHLKHVAADDRAFNYYHEWRNKYELYNRREERYCELCKLAHLRPPSVWEHMSEHFSRQDCIDMSTMEEQYTEKGAPNQSYPPPAYQYQPAVAQGPGGAPQPQVTVIQAYQAPVERPESYLIFSILTCLCCLWPIGLVALILSAVSRSSDDTQTAKGTGIAALVLNIISLVGGIACIITIVVLYTGAY